jgi:hypothetical protein
MSTEPSGEVASKIVDTMGVGQALLVCMRIIILIGERAEQTDAMIDAAKEAIAAVKRVGAVAGAFELS